MNNVENINNISVKIDNSNKKSISENVALFVILEISLTWITSTEFSDVCSDIYPDDKEASSHCSRGAMFTMWKSKVN